MVKSRRGYSAYLLRLWRVGDAADAGWRASLENAHTGERWGFASLDELLGFLRAEGGVAPEPVGYPEEGVMCAKKS